MKEIIKSPKKRKVIDIKKPKADGEINNYYFKRKETYFKIFFVNLIILCLLCFVVIFIINSLSAYYKGRELQKQISEKAYEGISMLLEGGKKTTQIQLENAKQAFIDAEKFFGEAKSKAWFIKSDRTSYGKKNNFNVAISGILDGGVAFANAGQYFLQAMDYFNLLPIYFVSKNKEPEKDYPSITETLKSGLQKIDLAVLEIQQATNKINEVNTDILPPDLREKAFSARKQLNEITSTILSIQEHYPAILKLLGDQKTHRYLILLQNNSELRPTGGFIGSYALIDIKEGYIEKLETHDVYHLRGAIGMQIEAPEDLHLYTTNWRFRDSNYSADFPLSAEKAIWFLEIEGGHEVDTVIAINQGLLRDLLEVTGPIQVGNFAKLDFDNFETVLSYVIESKMWGVENPKHILKVFIEEFSKEIMNEKYIAKVSGKLFRAIEQKHILFYSTDEEIMKLFDQLKISGRQYRPKENEDYISVINLSSGGTKSDKLIEEKIHHKTTIQDNGRIENTLKITRTHLYDNQVYNKWIQQLSSVGIRNPENYVIDILGRGRNRNSLQIYVPKGSRLISTNDANLQVKYDPELEKTYFFTTVEIYAGQSETIEIVYEIPYKINFEENYGIYRLMAEKMPGHPGQLFTKTLERTENIYPMLFYPETANKDSNGNIIYAKDLVYDRYFSSLVKLKNN